MFSDEHGQLFVTLAFVSATGNIIPTAFVFPRQNFKEFLTKDCLTGSPFLAHKTRWMTTDNFCLAFKHFVRHAKPSEANPVLLLLDNHESHISINVAIYAKESNVIILTFSHHCSDKLQPLDVSVFGLFPTFY